MKNVPKLRFKEFTDEWEEKKLNNILKIGNGKDYKNLGKGSIPVYGTGGIIEKINTYLYDGETIFIGRKGTINKPVYFNGKFWTVDTLFYTYDFKNNCVKFIYYVFNNIEWLSYNEATGVPSLSKTTILKIKKFFPCLQEQQKIADFLSGVDTKISLTEEKLENLKIYKKGIMQKIFSQEIRFKDKNGNDYPEWEEKKLGEIIKSKTSTITQNDLENNEGNYLVYGATGILKKINFYIMESRYIGIVKDGAGVGRTFLCKKKSSILATMNYLEILSNDKLEFCYYLLNTIDFTKYIVGSSIPHIYFKDYKEEKIKICILEEQQKIADFLSSIDNKIEKTENKLNELKEFKKGLLQKMFV